MSVMDRPEAVPAEIRQRVTASVVPTGIEQKVTYEENQLTDVHVKVPKLLWQAVQAMAEHLGTTKTNLVVRALNKEAFFNRVFDEDKGTRVVLERSDGSREIVNFV